MERTSLPGLGDLVRGRSRELRHGSCLDHVTIDLDVILKYPVYITGLLQPKLDSRSPGLGITESP